MQLVQPFEDHSDAYLATAALKSGSFPSGKLLGMLPILFCAARFVLAISK